MSLSINHTVRQFKFLCFINYNVRNLRQDYVLEFKNGVNGGLIHKDGKLFDHYLDGAIWDLAVELKSIGDEVTGSSKSGDTL